MHCKKSFAAMSLTLEQVQRIAHLARVEISESEASTTRDHLNGIFELIEQIRKGIGDVPLRMGTFS